MTKIKLLFLLLTPTLPFFLPITTFAIGEYYDPIYVKIEPTQSTKNTQTIARLKSQYGVSAFYNCYPCVYKDTSHPYTETSCLIQTEYCLERQQMFNSNNTKIEDPDASCKNNYGANSYYNGNKSANGSYICDCKGGYKWNDSKTTCILDDKDSDCKKLFGSYSYWTGEGHICNCLSGYEWQNNFCMSRVDKSQLIALPGEELSDKKIYIVKTIDGLIGNKPTRTTATCEELNAILNSDGSCQCAEGYGYSESRELCVKKLTTNLALPIPPAYVLEKQSETEQPTKTQPTSQPTSKKEVDIPPQENKLVIIADSEAGALQITNKASSATINQANQKNDDKQSGAVNSTELDKQSRFEALARSIISFFKKLFKH